MIAVDAGKYQVGDKVRVTTTTGGWKEDKPYTIARGDVTGRYTKYYFTERPGWFLYDDQFVAWEDEMEHTAQEGTDLPKFSLNTPIIDPINPDYYKFPSGAEVIDISEHLTSNGGQVIQYVTRSTRLDGRNKGDQVENLKKARWFLDREIERLSADA